VVLEPYPAKVLQGDLGDCWLMSALASSPVAVWDGSSQMASRDLCDLHRFLPHMALAQKWKIPQNYPFWEISTAPNPDKRVS